MERNIKFVQMTFAVLGLLSGTACDDDITGIERGELSWERIYSSDDGTQYFSMTVSADGILYVGTGNNILRYDEKGDSMVVVRKDGGALSLAISNNGTIYAGNFGSGMLRLSNDGQNWGQINTGLTNATVYDIDFNGANEIFIATGNGLFISSDDGNNWTRLNIDSILSQVQTIAVGPNGNIFVAHAWESGVYRSTDNGSNWSKLIDFHAYEIAVNSQGDTFAGAISIQSGFIRSTDDGITWTNIGPFFNDNRVWSIIFDSQDDIYIIDNGIFRSIDNGETWIASNDGLPSSNISTLAQYENDVFYCAVDSIGIYRGTFARR